MDEIKPKRKSVVFGLAKGEEKLTTSLVQYKSTALKKSIVNILNGDEGSIERLAFDTDPTQHTTLAGVYQPKTKGVPDDILKRIAVQDSLVSNIVRARQNHISVFGRPRPDRFSTGFIIEPNTGVLDNLSKEEKEELDVRIERSAFMLKNCGNTSGMEDEDKITLVECMILLTRNAIVNGRIALEIIYTGEGDSKKFHHFAPIDASTIYKAAEKNQSAQQGIRDQAWSTLQSITGKKLKKERYDNNDYKWIQVFAGRPLGAFTGEEVKCYNFYPVPDIEWNGYPVTPIDTVITSITTHINIVNHNRLYFQSGRATRGMLVISSDDDNPQVIHNIKQQFNASINNVNNCLAGSTTFINRQGQTTYQEFLGKDETKMTEVWTGTEWCEAMIYKVAEPKVLCSLELANGTKIETSPDHRFLAIGPNGDPSWKTQKELAVGDFLAVNKKEVSNSDNIPEPVEAKGTNKGWGTSNSIPFQTVQKYLTIVKNKTKLPRGGDDHNAGLSRVFTPRQQMDIDAILRGEDSCSLSRLINYMQVAEVEIPQWMSNFNYESVVSVKNTGEFVQMYDSTVYDKHHGCTGASCKSDKHSLITNGILTHQSWRMPVFGCGIGEAITWQPIDSGGQKDAEFQYLTDMNAREILTAFMMSPDELPGWSYLSRGTSNQALCLSQDSKIIEKNQGLLSIGDYLNQSQERFGVFWTGTEWVPGRAFITGPRCLAKTELGNGVVSKASPDHRFRSIGPDGVPVWTHQRDLKEGDVVLVNKHPVPGNEELVPSYKGRQLTPDVLEALGWLTGDGSIGVRLHPRTGNVKQGVLTWYYHHEKERDIWERHSKVLQDWGLSLKHNETEISLDEQEAIKARYGFKNVASTRIKNSLYDTEFVMWLLDLGFQTSKDGKVIPAVLGAWPEQYRAAFLRGLFSADGTLIKRKGASKAGVRIVIHDNNLRQQTAKVGGPRVKPGVTPPC